MARSRSAAFSLRVSASLCSSVTTCPVLAERNAAPATPAAASSAENPPAYTTMAPASGMTAPPPGQRGAIAGLMIPPLAHTGGMTPQEDPLNRRLAKRLYKLSGWLTHIRTPQRMYE